MSSARFHTIRLDDFLALLFTSLLGLFFLTHPGAIPTEPFFRFFAFILFYGFAFFFGRWAMVRKPKVVPARLLSLAVVVLLMAGFSFGTADRLTVDDIRTFLLLVLPLFLGAWAASGLQEDPGGWVRRMGRDFLPFLISQGAYLLLHEVVHIVNPVDRDGLLLALDQALFGVALTQALQPYVSTLLTEWFSATYALFLFLQLGLALFLVGKRARAPLLHLLQAIVLCNYLGYLGYLLVPAIGPMYTLPFVVPLSGGWFFALKESLDQLARVPRDCFPSLHTANTFVVLLVTWRYTPRLLWMLLPLGGSCILATVYLRYHYTVDVLAGFLLGGGMFWAVPRLERLWQLVMRQSTSDASV